MCEFRGRTACGPGGAGARRGSGRRGRTAPEARLGAEIRMEELGDRVHLYFGDVGRMTTGSGPIYWPPRLEELRTHSGHLLYSRNSTEPTLRCSRATGAGGHMGLCHPSACLWSWCVPWRGMGLRKGGLTLNCPTGRSTLQEALSN